jgi:phage terminase large subunit
LEAIRRDPVGFLREVLRFECWSKQAEIACSVRDHKRTAVRSAHGVGKTAIAARIALWFLAAFPRSRVITTAPVWSQVKEQLWREIAVAYAAADGFFDGQLSDTKLELDVDWFALGLSTDRPERFAGHHAEHLLLIVDEASGLDEAIFEAAEGFLTSANAKVLVIGNPTALAGTFYRAFHSERTLWNTITVSAFDTPVFTGERVSEAVLRRLVSREWVESARKKWGEDSPLYQVRVLGDFPSSADDTVCPVAAVELAQRQQVEPGSPVIVSCDPARFGSDESVIAVRRGSRVRIAATYGKKDLMETAGRMLRVARAEAAKGRAKPLLVVDDVGIGGGLVDRLRELREFPVESFNGAGAARNPRDYPNARSQAWFDFAEKLASIDLDDDEQLAADLVAPTYRIDSRGRRAVEAKAETRKRLGRSPDRADAVLMAFAAANRRPMRTYVPRGRIDHDPLRTRARSAGTVPMFARGGVDPLVEIAALIGVPVQDIHEMDSKHRNALSRHH